MPKHNYLRCGALMVLVLLHGAPAKAADFYVVLRDAYQTHPAILAERQALAAVEQNLPEAYSGFLPSVNLSYDRGRQRVEYNKQNRPTETTKTKGATLTQPIFNGGGTIAQIREARAQIRASEARLRQVEYDTLLRVISAYADLAEKQQVHQLSQENVQALEEHLSGTRKQYGLGDVTVSNISESESRLARARAEFEDAKGALESARETYRREVAQEPDAIHMPPLPASLPPTLDEILKLAETNPLKLQAEQNEEVASRRVDRQVANFLPSVRFDMAYRNADGTTTPNLNEVDERSMMFRVAVPIFQAGAEYTQLQRARHQYRQAQDQLDDTKREVRRFALTEWHNYESSSQAIEAHLAAMNAADKAYDNVRTEQLAGTRTVLDVLNARQELFATRINLARSQTRQLISAYRLLAATDQLFVATTQYTPDTPAAAAPFVQPSAEEVKIPDPAPLSLDSAPPQDMAGQEALHPL